MPINNLDPSIASSSPSLFAAAATSGLNDQQVNMVNQIMGTVSTYKKLSTMPVQQAKEQYKILDPNAQSMLKDMYGNPEFTNLDSNVMKVVHAVGGALKNVVVGAGNPLVAQFKLVGEYGKVINAPYLYSRELTQGNSAFSSKTYGAAWDGRNVFDQGSLKELQNKYGNAAVFVAQGLLKGEKPGQILDSYGKVDADIYKALANMYGNDKNWQNFMGEMSAAQVSPGRDISRVMYNTPTSTNLHTPNKFSSLAEQWNKRGEQADAKLSRATSQERTAGIIDAFYELAHDPLTYFGGDLSKIGLKGLDASSALLKGQAAADRLVANPAARAAAAEDIFKPGTQISKSWDNLYGPLIKRYVEADKEADPIAKQAVMRDIQQSAPEINSRPFLKLAGKALTEHGFDANGAKEWVKTLEGAQEMSSGLVDGPTFQRLGIPYARNERHITSALNKALSDFMNGAKSDKDIDLMGTALTGKEKLLEEGRQLDPLTSKPGVESGEFLDNLSNQMTFKRRLARLAQTHPGSEGIGVMDDTVDESIPTVNRYLRLIFPRYAADVMAESYRYLNPIDRTIFLRGMYNRVMLKMDVPEELRRAILEKKFADSTTFANGKDIAINPAHLEYWKQTSPLVHAPEEGADNLFRTTTNGPIHAFQGATKIGGLDFTGEELGRYGFNFNKRGSVPWFLYKYGGMPFRSLFAKRITNMWGTGSIAPRMGMRGTVEQGIFHYLTAPWENLVGFYRGRQLNKLGIGVAGDLSNLPYGARLRMKIFGKSLANWVPSKSIYKQINGEDMKVLQGYLDRHIVNGQEVWTAAQPHDIINAVEDRINKLSGGDPETADVMRTFLKYPSASQSAAVNSVIARSTIHQGITGGELEQQLLTRKGISRMLKELGYKATGGLRNVNPDEIAMKFGDAALSAAHYRTWAPMFQRFNVLDGFHFGANFVKNNALRTGKDFDNARNAILTHFGVDPVTKEVKNAKQFNKYLQFSMQAGRDVAERGMTPVDSAIERIQLGLQDMYKTFHGSPIKFNHELTNHILLSANEEIANGASKTNAIIKALDSIEYDNFDRLTKFNRPTEEFKSDLDFANHGLWESIKAGDTDGVDAALTQAVKRFGEGGVQGKILHYMDLQINWLFNQPAFDAAKITLFKKWAPWREEMYNTLRENGYSEETAKDITDRHFVEKAEKEAAASVIKYVDNAAKQSVLSHTVRVAGRFYRAQEQFMRRTYRMKDVLPRVLWRERLLHLGIDNFGLLHKDKDGNPYLTIPADNIVYHGINGPLSFMMGHNKNEAVSPEFAEFNMNLINSSPSLGPDAGVPAFSGPMMSIPILGLKTLFKDLPWGWSQQASTNIDTLMLGQKSANLTAGKLLPVFLQRILDAMPKNEKDSQVASAAAIAVAFNAAHGYGSLTPAGVEGLSTKDYVTASEKMKSNVLATANNVLFIRALLGMISPIAPTVAGNTKGISGYVKNTGINGFSPEFADILQGVLKNDTGLTDPYEIALGMFTAKYPGRAVYTVGKSDKATKLLQTYTAETEQWMQNHSTWTNNDNSSIAAASLIFAPHTGEYDSNAYQWMQSMGLIKSKKLSDYIRDVLTAQDDAAYQNAAYREKVALTQPGADRAAIIADAQAEQQAILASNPTLALVQGDVKTQISKYGDLHAALGSILDNPKFPVNSATRKKMQLAWKIADSAINNMKSDTAASGALDTTATKADIKTKAINAIAELGGAAKPGDAPVDPQIAEALKSIWEPLFNNLSKNTIKVGTTR